MEEDEHEVRAEWSERLWGNELHIRMQWTTPVEIVEQVTLTFELKKEHSTLMETE